MKTIHNLSQGRIARLEEVGFQWQVEKHSRSTVASRQHSKRSLDTAMFLNVIQAIRHWDAGCSNMKSAQKIQKGMKTNSNSHKTGQILHVI